MQTLISVGCSARMRREISCRNFRSWDASRRGAVIGSARSRISADGRRAAWRAETTRIECDFSAADGLQSRRARSHQARRRCKLRVNRPATSQRKVFAKITPPTIRRASPPSGASQPGDQCSCTSDHRQMHHGLQEMAGKRRVLPGGSVPVPH